MFLLLVIFCLIFFYIELPLAYKEGNWKEFILSSVILIIAISYGLDHLLDLQLMPDPSAGLSRLSPFAEAFNRFFSAKI